MQWQIIIPMSGFGERFRRAGYTLPKPLIPVNDEPIIAHVLKMFPGETNFHFICNREHLENSQYKMRETLEAICPTGTIHSIEPHKKGPVYAVSRIFNSLDPSLPVAVSYCDFTGQWNWNAFKVFMEESKCDGAVICYTGFHPHMLACTKFAYCKTDGTDKVIAIQEKQPYTDTPMKEWASCGIYCFRSGALLRDIYTKTLQRDDLTLNGEWYASLAYRPLLEEGGDVRVFPMDKFCQWGTPEDLSDWTTQFMGVQKNQTPQETVSMQGCTLMPMAGLGSRFVKAGYTIPKPLIPINNESMVLSAWQDLPKTKHTVFVMRKDMPGAQEIEQTLSDKISDSEIVWLDAMTDGQARTCLIGMEKATSINPEEPLTIAACDNGLRYDAQKFNKLWNEEKPDVVVWTVRGHAGAVRHPEYYGWVDADEQHIVKKVSVKVSLYHPEHDPIVTGVFTFRKASFFRDAANAMIARKGMVNNEFYVDECINDAVNVGLKVIIFDVDAYLCWGTPDDLRIWEYWQEYIRGMDD